jgi:hypothetical protein
LFSRAAVTNCAQNPSSCTSIWEFERACQQRWQASRLLGPAPGLPAVHSDRGFARAAIGTAIIKINSLDYAPLTREVDNATSRLFVEAMLQSRTEGLIVTKRHLHIAYFDRGTIDPDLQLAEFSLSLSDIDPVTVPLEIHLSPAQQLPPGPLRSPGERAQYENEREYGQELITFHKTPPLLYLDTG